jgi:hypothetical protein
MIRSFPPHPTPLPPGERVGHSSPQQSWGVFWHILIKEVPSLQRYVARPSLSELFKGKKGKERKAEDKTIYAVYVRYGYSMKEIAEHLGFHYATISRAIKRMEGL